MLASQSVGFDDELVLGTGGNDVLRAERSVSFVWIQDAAQASEWGYSLLKGEGSFERMRRQADGYATGRVTFDNLSSTQPFSTKTDDLDFSFSNDPGYIYQYRYTMYSVVHPTSDPSNAGGPPYPAFTIQAIPPNDLNRWSWDPSSQVLDAEVALYSRPEGNSVSLSFGASVAGFYALYGNSAISNQTEYGRWVLDPNPQDTSVFGGGGNDTVWGSAGSQVLNGGGGRRYDHHRPR